MNIVEIKGGLGNQLFQYAFCKYLEKATGNTSLLWTGFYDYCKDMGGTIREYSLDKFCIPAITMKGRFVCASMVKEEDFSDSQINDNTFFSGYWQNKCFFEQIRNELLSELIPKEELLSQEVLSMAENIADTPESVALHIRRQVILTI